MLIKEHNLFPNKGTGHIWQRIIFLKPGESLLVEAHEYNGKDRFDKAIKARGKTHNLELAVAKLPDDGGWLVTREP